ncbi:putative Phytosulfokine 3 [Melia azedarach]|uniref:Phytosulfokine 3 n=1 Tax=Melia azedarach TaxID=155640 RepID=A0ACC1X166_MELAZ|nr:putative Phytosulfokine 3 [Melia azedarach]
MKHKFHLSLIFLLFTFFLLSYSISVPQNQGENEMKAGGSGITHASTLEEIKEDFMNLMGSDSEGCEEQGEECLKRRMIADAHLDYIYTQHHKP